MVLYYLKITDLLTPNTYAKVVVKLGEKREISATTSRTKCYFSES
jgi:hypothetical protein